MPIAMGANTVPTGIDPTASNQSLDRWFNNCTILANGTRSRCASADEQAAWTVRPANTLQTWSSRITSVRQPGIYNLDLALMKGTNILERYLFTFRAARSEEHTSELQSLMRSSNACLFLTKKKI